MSILRRAADAFWELVTVVESIAFWTWALIASAAGVGLYVALVLVFTVAPLYGAALIVRALS